MVESFCEYADLDLAERNVAGRLATKRSVTQAGNSEVHNGYFYAQKRAIVARRRQLLGRLAECALRSAARCHDEAADAIQGSSQVV